MDIIHRISKAFPNLENKLRTAHMKQRPDDFVKKIFKLSLIISFLISTIIFFFLGAFRQPIILIIPGFFIFFFLSFLLMMQSPNSVIAKRQRELDREVLFAGRYLLIKINSGRPLINALYDASNSYGIAAKYFKEITDDISIGTPIEKALDNAMKYSPSDKYKKILFQISNSIKIGTDVSESLAVTLNDISNQQLIEIQRYGKKLGSLSLFYMLIAIIIPSLGMAMIVIIGSLMGLFAGSTTTIFLAMFVFIVVVQLFFIALFKQTRVTVNI